MTRNKKCSTLVFLFFSLLQFTLIAQHDTVNYSRLSLNKKQYFYDSIIFTGYVKGYRNEKVVFEGKVINGKKNGLWFYYSEFPIVHKSIDFGEYHCVLTEYGQEQKINSVFVLETDSFYPERFDELFDLSINGLYFYYDKNCTITSFKEIKNHTITWFIYNNKGGFRKKK